MEMDLNGKVGKGFMAYLIPQLCTIKIFLLFSLSLMCLSVMCLTELVSW